MVAAEGSAEAEVEAAIRKAIDENIAQGRLSKWAAPERVTFVEALPKTSVGKLDKKALRAVLAAK